MQWVNELSQCKAKVNDVEYICASMQGTEYIYITMCGVHMSCTIFKNYITIIKLKCDLLNKWMTHMTFTPKWCSVICGSFTQRLQIILIYMLFLSTEVKTESVKNLSVLNKMIKIDAILCQPVASRELYRVQALKAC